MRIIIIVLGVLVLFTAVLFAVLGVTSAPKRELQSLSRVDLSSEESLVSREEVTSSASTREPAPSQVTVPPPVSPAPSPAPVPVPTPTLAPPAPTASTAGATYDLRVGPQETYKTLASAIAVAKAGDRIGVDAGVYKSDYAVITKVLTIVGVGGKAHFQAEAPIPNGKAIFVTNADITLENIEFSNAKVPDRNGAGIRHEGGILKLTNTSFHDNEEGILTAPSGGEIHITNSEFLRNGYGDGRSHGVYTSPIKRLVISNSTFKDTKEGHHVKSRADETIISNSTFDDGTTASSYSVEAPNGGVVRLTGNTFIQSANASNKIMIAYGAEGSLKPVAELTIANNTFKNSAPAAYGVYNWTQTPAKLTGNTFSNVATILQGPGTVSP